MARAGLVAGIPVVGLARGAGNKGARIGSAGEVGSGRWQCWRWSEGCWAGEKVVAREVEVGVVVFLWDGRGLLRGRVSQCGWWCRAVCLARHYYCYCHCHSCCWCWPGHGRAGPSDALGSLSLLVRLVWSMLSGRGRDGWVGAGALIDLTMDGGRGLQQDWGSGVGGGRRWEEG